MMRNSYLKNQKGFTLVEIAIVLVIVGLLIGGILKGQSMIRNAKVKRLVNEIEGIRAAALSYQDRYGMLPGDESDANAPIGDSATQGDNDGYFDAAETGLVMEDLRLAELISGTGTTLPTHAYGGAIRLQYQNVGGSGNRNQIITTNVPAEVCQEIDSKYDDGVYNAGDIRGSAAYTANGTVATFAWKFN